MDEIFSQAELAIAFPFEKSHIGLWILKVVKERVLGVGLRTRIGLLAEANTTTLI